MRKPNFYEMCYRANSSGVALFQMSGVNFDVLETRMVERMREAGINEGTVSIYRDGVDIGTYGVGTDWGTRGTLGKTNFAHFDQELRP